MKLDYNEFFEKIFKNLDEVGIDYFSFQLDHVAYRTTSIERYKELKEYFSLVGSLIDEAIIRNRPIGIFKLKEPIIYKDFSIPYFEIMAPGEGDNYKEGLEHAEFVIDTSLDELKNKYPNLNFIFKDRKINPELVLKFDNGANIKFHLKDIETVIKLQNETGEL